MLTKLIKTAISAVLLNKAMRSAFLAGLIKSLKWTLQPSTRSGIMAFFAKLANSVSRSVPGKGSSNLLSILLELLLLRFAKRSGFLGPAALSALAALLLGTLRGKVDNSGKNSRRQKDQIIDHDDYTILDDRH
ncbi:MAG: hypothetical protein PHS80_06560 [Methanothrix sp.]|nr:hypothetical protein [Methanothrix sp.]